MTERCRHCGDELKEGDEGACGECFRKFRDESAATECMICDEKLESDYEREVGICGDCLSRDQERCEAIALKHKKEIRC